jgi:hypothetical protein
MTGSRRHRAWLLPHVSQPHVEVLQMKLKWKLGKGLKIWSIPGYRRAPARYCPEVRTVLW